MSKPEDNALTIFKSALPAVSDDQLDTLEEVAQSSDFLPRIQLITKGQYVDTGKIAPGRWGVPLVGGEEIEDLGEKIDVIPFCFRAKAIDVNDKENIITVYDTKSEEFARIKAAPKNTGCMWGPSFLVLERSTGKLYELFFSNKSGRNEAGKMRPFLPTEENGGVPSPVTLKIRYVKKEKYAWHVPVITKCSEPFDPTKVKITDEQLMAEREKFLNPPAAPEKVEEKDDDGRAR